MKLLDILFKILIEFKIYTVRYECVCVSFTFKC